MLGVPGKLAYKVDGNALTITMPNLGTDKRACRHAYAIKIPARRSWRRDRGGHGV